MKIHPLTFVFIMMVMMAFAYCVGSAEDPHAAGLRMGQYAVDACVETRGMDRAACMDEISLAIFGKTAQNLDGMGGGVFQK